MFPASRNEETAELRIGEDSFQGHKRAPHRRLRSDRLSLGPGKNAIQESNRAGRWRGGKRQGARWGPGCLANQENLRTEAGDEDTGEGRWGRESRG